MRRGGLAAPASATELDGDDVLRLGAVGPLGSVELHLRTLGERLEAVAGDGRVVDEQVLALVRRGDEAVPLRIVEPLDGSGCHEKTPPRAMKNGQRRRTVRDRYSLESASTVARNRAGSMTGWRGTGRATPREAQLFPVQLGKRKETTRVRHEPSTAAAVSTYSCV